MEGGASVGVSGAGPRIEVPARQRQGRAEGQALGRAGSPASALSKVGRAGVGRAAGLPRPALPACCRERSTLGYPVGHALDERIPNARRPEQSARWVPVEALGEASSSLLPPADSSSCRRPRWPARVEAGDRPDRRARRERRNERRREGAGLSILAVEGGLEEGCRSVVELRGDPEGRQQEQRAEVEVGEEGDSEGHRANQRIVRERGRTGSQRRARRGRLTGRRPGRAAAGPTHLELLEVGRTGDQSRRTAIRERGRASGRSGRARGAAPGRAGGRR